MTSDCVPAPGYHVSQLPVGTLQHIFHFLGPRDLCCVSATCRLWRELNRDHASNQAWQAFFTQRWQPPALGGPPVPGGRIAAPGAAPGVMGGSSIGQPESWQARYGRKVRQQHFYGGTGQRDVLYGHAAGVRCLGLLPSANLLATGSMDRTVRVWDLGAGLPAGVSRPQRGPVRALALDERLLVAGGSQGGAMRVWRSGSGAGGRPAFDLARSSTVAAHSGPISALALDDRHVYSGSWDFTARLWRRSGLACAAVLRFGDFVDGLCPRGPNLLVVAGHCAYVHDLATGRRLRQLGGRCSSVGRGAGLENGRMMALSGVACVEGTRDGRCLLAGMHDGAALLLDLRSDSPRPVAVLWEPRPDAPVAAVSFDDPWLAAAIPGAAVLVSAEAALRGGRGGPRSPRAGAGSAGGAAAARRAGCGGGAPRRFGGAGACVACVGVADHWLAYGGDAEAVRTWDFSGVGAAEARVAAGRAQRAAQRGTAQRAARGRGATWSADSDSASDDSGAEDGALGLEDDGVAAWDGAVEGDIGCAQGAQSAGGKLRDGGGAEGNATQAACKGCTTGLTGVEDSLAAVGRCPRAVTMQSWRIVQPRSGNSSRGACREHQPETIRASA